MCHIWYVMVSWSYWRGSFLLNAVVLSWYLGSLSVFWFLNKGIVSFLNGTCLFSSGGFVEGCISSGNWGILFSCCLLLINSICSLLTFVKLVMAVGQIGCSLSIQLGFQKSWSKLFGLYSPILLSIVEFASFPRLMRFWYFLFLHLYVRKHWRKGVCSTGRRSLFLAVQNVSGLSRFCSCFDYW